jgi:hypothetical protein
VHGKPADVLQEQSTRPHPDKIRSFERATPNQLWQTDLFTFVLKRQNRRVYSTTEPMDGQTSSPAMNLPPIGIGHWRPV